MCENFVQRQAFSWNMNMLKTMNAGFLPIAKKKASGYVVNGPRKWVENASFGTIGSPTHTHKGA